MSRTEWRPHLVKCGHLGVTHCCCSQQRSSPQLASCDSALQSPADCTQLQWFAHHTKCSCGESEQSGFVQVLRVHRDTLLSVLETLVHDPLVEWVPKNAKSGAEEQENAMARDAMATIEGETPSSDHVGMICASLTMVI